MIGRLAVQSLAAYVACALVEAIGLAGIELR
jgi:hypothetical protein